MTQADLHNQLIAQFNRLYITYRKQFLQQHPDGYSTQKYTLSDNIIRQHLLFKRTVGVKLGAQGMASFLAFDVDYAGCPAKAQETAINLIQHLHDYWGIPLDEIHCDFSGSKGYHVTLFFDEVIQDTNLKPFYQAVIDKIGVSIHEVEFRCSKQYGMKLPLGINQKSQLFMCFVEYNPITEQLRHMSKAESYDYFLGITQSNLNDFRELILEELEPTAVPNALHSTGLTAPQATETEDALSEINTAGKSHREYEADLKTVILNQRLIYPSTRNDMTHYLSIFYKGQGYEQHETIDLINAIMLNTYYNFRELINADTTLEYILNETNRVTGDTYTKDYTFARTEQRKEIVFYKDEILAVLAVKEYQLKKMAFSLLIQSKRYSNNTTGVFYTAHSTLTRMGNTGNRSNLLKYIQQLEALGLLEIVSCNQLDERLSRINGRATSRPNSYKLLINHDEAVTESMTVQPNSKVTLEQMTAEFINKKDARKKLPKGQWESHFKEAYS